MEVKKLDPVQTGIVGFEAAVTGQQVFFPAALSTSSASATSATVVVASVSAVGGQMGPNGVMLIEVFGQITNTTGGARTLTVGSASIPYTHTLTSGNYASGNSGYIYYCYSLRNQNDEAVNYAQDYLELGITGGAATAYGGPFSVLTQDTSQDIVYNVEFTLSSSGNLSWLVFLVKASTSYGAAFV